MIDNMKANYFKERKAGVISSGKQVKENSCYSTKGLILIYLSTLSLSLRPLLLFIDDLGKSAMASAKIAYIHFLPRLKVNLHFRHQTHWPDVPKDDPRFLKEQVLFSIGAAGIKKEGDSLGLAIYGRYLCIIKVVGRELVFLSDAKV